MHASRPVVGDGSLYGNDGVTTRVYNKRISAARRVNAANLRFVEGGDNHASTVSSAPVSR